MDIKQLKEEARKYIAAMEADGKDFTFAALIPNYPGLSDTSYTLQVQADWIKGLSFKKVLDYMVPKLFAVLDQPTRRWFIGIDTFDEKGELFCMSEDMILVNKINYNPANYYMNALRSQQHY